MGEQRRAESAPAILTVNQHAIDPTKFEGRIWQIARVLQRNHYLCYVVGGAVRDLLLNKTPKDCDLVSDATPNQIKRLFRNAFLVGKRFRLAHIRYGKDYIEVATFRKEADTVLPIEEGEDFARHKRVYGSPRDDAFRRDFTVNGMFYDLATRRVIDYVGGLPDLEDRLVRTIVDPDLSLTEDCVRMLRAVRLSGRHQFTIEAGLRGAIIRHADTLAAVSKSRLYEELGNLLYYGAA
ncbi:MAG TPA: CCA tRNA nucleotidyltransferase, partial [bacterium]|nr:CCA tRNA nucleotidyltransferase [bacterium]